MSVPSHPAARTAPPTKRLRQSPMTIKIPHHRPSGHRAPLAHGDWKVLRIDRSRLRRQRMKRWLPIALIALVVLLGVSSVGTYNSQVRLDQSVRSQWGQVQNVYQRRADLVPNLVATVKGAAAFEKDTYTAVAAARAQVGQVAAGTAQAFYTKRQSFPTVVIAGFFGSRFAEKPYFEATAAAATPPQVKF